MKACQEDGVVRGEREARRNGAVAHLRAQSGQRRGWGGGEFGCGRTQRRCAGVVVDAAGDARRTDHRIADSTVFRLGSRALENRAGQV